MDASDESLSQLMGLALRFASMRGRTVYEVIRAVLASRTLLRSGYREGGNLTQVQCDSGIAVLEQWIGKVAG